MLRNISQNLLSALRTSVPLEMIQTENKKSLAATKWPAQGLLVTDCVIIHGVQILSTPMLGGALCDI